MEMIMDYDLDNDTNRDFDDMWFSHSSQLMSMRGLSPQKAAAASLALLRRVFGTDPSFSRWLERQNAAREQVQDPA